MKIKITESSENALLARREVKFRIEEIGATPSRTEVRSRLASDLGVDREGIIIDHIRSNFGERSAMGYAKIYSSFDDAKKVEPEHLIKRNVSVKEDTNKEEK
jgi:small subunit ribosomal protein S24e